MSIINHVKGKSDLAGFNSDATTIWVDCISYKKG